MTQQLFVGQGPVGFQVTMVGPEGPVVASLGAGSAGPVVSVLGPFNTAVSGAVGSGRLVDVPLAQFTALPNGTLAYVASLQCYFVRYTSGVAVAADNITIIKPLGGGSLELWVRLPATSYTFQVQTQWHIDEAAGDDEATGLAQATALRSDAEVQRRLGYRCRCDVPVQVHTYGNVTRLTCTRNFGTNGSVKFFAHGQTLLFTSAAGFTAHTDFAPATNVDQAATDATVPTGTWAGAGFTPAFGRSPRRVRFTSGAQTGAVMWPNHDLGGGACNFSRKILPSQSIAISPRSGTSIVNGDAYVVESLPTCGQVLVDVTFEDASLTFFGEFVIFNDYSFPEQIAFTNVINAPGGGVRFNGCDTQDLVPTAGVLFAIACNVDGPVVGEEGPGGQLWMQGCNITRVNSAACPVVWAGSIVLSEFTVAEGCALVSTGWQAAVYFACCAAFRSNISGAQLIQGAVGSAAAIFGTTGGNGVVFGSGNALAGVQMLTGGNFQTRIATNVTITGASGDFTMGAQTSGYRWNDAAGAYDFAFGKISYTWAHYAANFGAGGFSERLFDPLTLCFLNTSAN